jgi:hypothetical protein
MLSHVPVKTGFIQAILMSWNQSMLRGLRMPLIFSAYPYVQCGCTVWYKYGRFPCFADLHTHFIPLLSPLFIPDQATNTL